MAIRQIEKATIACDDCGKEIAKIRASVEALAVLDREKRYIEVVCMTHADPALHAPEVTKEV